MSNKLWSGCSLTVDILKRRAMQIVKAEDRVKRLEEHRPIKLKELEHSYQDFCVIRKSLGIPGWLSAKYTKHKYRYYHKYKRGYKHRYEDDKESNYDCRYKSKDK